MSGLEDREHLGGREEREEREGRVGTFSQLNWSCTYNSLLYLILYLNPYLNLYSALYPQMSLSMKKKLTAADHSATDSTFLFSFFLFLYSVCGGI